MAQLHHFLVELLDSLLGRLLLVVLTEDVQNQVLDDLLLVLLLALEKPVH